MSTATAVHIGGKEIPSERRVSPSQIRIRSKAEAAQTVGESFAIDRGFLSRSATAATLLAVVVLLAWPKWEVVPLGILLADYGVFFLRRRRALDRYEAGAPRLGTPADFEAMSDAFKARGIPEPSMTDWHQAAGLSDAPEWRESLRYRIAASFYRGGKLLDVGSGDGRLCWRFGACSPDDYIGADVSPGLLETLREKTDGRSLAIVSVAENLRLPDASVDLIVCSECFEHLPEPGAALAEFARVLRPGGRVVIQSPSALRMRNFNPVHLLSLAVGYWFPGILLPKVVHPNTFAEAFTYHWDFTRQQLRGYTRASGLRIESMRGATYRFNPAGSLPHRIGYRLFRAPLVHWLGWDFTAVLSKS